MKISIFFILSACMLSLHASSFADPSPLWMRYPAISPDGQSIVFSHKGDLFIVASKGGKARPLTIHEAHEYMPVWSPDGKFIAFASDRYGNFDVFIMPSEGGEARRLTFHSNNDLPSGFSPDGKHIIFTSNRGKTHQNVQFPIPSQLYKVDVSGGQPKKVLDLTAESARYNKIGNKIIYHDWKGYEDSWRKHHTSSVTRDVWIYDIDKDSYQQISDFDGEDRNPLFSPDEKSVYYLSEKSGDFNVWKIQPGSASAAVQLTHFEKHPVRFLSQADNGLFCFGWHGEIYTMVEGNTPQKVNIELSIDSRLVDEKNLPVSGGVTEFDISPNGKEVAFIFRGEVFVSAVEGGMTKRITNTPGQERSISFSPDGRSLIYAGERDNSWNIYQAKIVRDEDPYFYASTLVKEEAIIAGEREEFQPIWSPDGKEIAYLEDRTTLRVYNLGSKTSRTVLPGTYNYSYSDGDQYFAWSPDSKWLLVQYIPLGGQIFVPEAGLINADGKSKPINLTLSGYSDRSPKWTMDGKMMLWFSDRDGMKNHASWGGESDVYGMFFTKEAFDRFKLSKEEFALIKEREDKEKNDKNDKNDKKEDTDKNKQVKPLSLELEDIDKRKARLTIHSSRLSDAVLSKDGEKLYYLARFEKGTDLWSTELRTKETKLISKDAGSSLKLSDDGKLLFLISNGNIVKINTENDKKENVSIKGEMKHNYLAEKAYIFDHAWRQVVEKFYVTDLHNVDWTFYREEYKKFLPHINNNHDFAEMLSEMLGELNASHTGCRYSPTQNNGDVTASLAIFIDEKHEGAGIKIAEVIKNGPFDKAGSKVRSGMVIEKIDGETFQNYYHALNRKTGQFTLISLLDPSNNTRFDQVVKPISLSDERELLYQRWVENRRQETEKVSGGKIGYVHVRGMNDGSYRTVYEEVMGRHYSKEGLVVDTRFNGGGWLHDDLATFLSGNQYMSMVPREQTMGREPMSKWVKPVNLLMGESNYSDAHLFPVTFKAYDIGKTVGMPVPGTGTAVWWEQQIDPTLVFGIPQVGMVDMQGNYMENTQLEPDIKVNNEPGVMTLGRDQQIEKAVEDLLKTIENSK
ncbi:MAG: PD40 domain-containing protein [Cyclobacteriaceae bacterium]|nr:PD40 domain-containing protein [Cyclobacteriaceae bacterium]